MVPITKFSEYTQILGEIGKSFRIGNLEAEYHKNQDIGYYGGWMHPEHQIIIFVGNQTHWIVIKQLQRFFPEWNKIPVREDFDYKVMYEQGWIRFVYPSTQRPGSRTAGFQGYQTDLRKLSSKFWNDIVETGFRERGETPSIEVIDPNTQRLQSFYAHKDIQSFMQGAKVMQGMSQALGCRLPKYDDLLTWSTK